MPACAKCGTGLDGSEKFCPKCGQNQEVRPVFAGYRKKGFGKLCVAEAGHSDQLLESTKLMAKRQIIGLVGLVILLVAGVSVFAGIRFLDGTAKGGRTEDSAAVKSVEENKVEKVVNGGIVETHTIVGLFPLTGDLSIFGENSTATAGLAAEDIGVEYLIMGWRGDTWGDGLHAATTASARELGVVTTSANEIRFNPTQNNFRDEAQLPDRFVTEFVKQGAALNKIGFCLIAFDEAVSFLAEATKYSQLSQIIWIGSDGTVLSEAIKSNYTAAKFASEVKFINPMSRFGKLGTQSRHEHVSNHVITTLNRECDEYAYNTYDIIWALALAIDEVGYDRAAVKKV